MAAVLYIPADLQQSCRVYPAGAKEVAPRTQLTCLTVLCSEIPDAVYERIKPRIPPNKQKVRIINNADGIPVTTGAACSHFRLWYAAVENPKEEGGEDEKSGVAATEDAATAAATAAAAAAAAATTEDVSTGHVTASVPISDTETINVVCKDLKTLNLLRSLASSKTPPLNERLKTWWPRTILSEVHGDCYLEFAANSTSAPACECSWKPKTLYLQQKYKRQPRRTYSRKEY